MQEELFILCLSLHIYLSITVPARKAGVEIVPENQQFCDDFHLDSISLLD